MSIPAELVSTGSELLSGRTVNGHAATLGELLRTVGFHVSRDTTVGDEFENIADAVRGALSRVDFVFVSGGLGPTSDDITRDVVAQVVGRGVTLDDGAYEAMVKRYRALGRTPSKECMRQVMVVEGAEVLLNPAGIAPGERIDYQGKSLFVLPGPPSEFLSVITHHIIPWIAGSFPAAPALDERLFLVTGLGESDIATGIENSDVPLAGIEVGYCAAPGRVEIRISSSDPTAAEALDRASSGIRGLFGDHIYAEERVSLEDIVLQRCAGMGCMLSTAESGTTRGWVASRLSCSDHADGVFAGGVTILDKEILVNELGVERDDIEQHGTATEAVALQMAEAVRIKFQSKIGFAVTDVAELEGDARRVRFFCAYTDGSRQEVREFTVGGSRPRLLEWATQSAMDQLRREVGPRKL